MRFYVARTLEKIKMYGPIYDFGSAVPDKVDEYFVEDFNDWFLDNMIDRINATCDTLLDDGDVDYISAEMCKELVTMLNNLPQGFVPKENREAVDVLLEYAKRAIDYNTGIEIEM